MSLKTLETVFEHLVDQITYIINFCLSSTATEARKQALVDPLTKVPDPEKFSQLRPISLLPVPSFQLCFRKYHSTTTTPTAFTDDIFIATNNGSIYYAII